MLNYNMSQEATQNYIEILEYTSEMLGIEEVDRIIVEIESKLGSIGN